MNKETTVQRRRNSLRLASFDYSQPGAYFVTLCTHNQECLFGRIADGAMQLNEPGHLVAHAWRESLAPYLAVTLDEWVLMPNHLHGILVFDEHASTAPQEITRNQRRNMLLSKCIGRFKMVSAKQVNAWRKTPGRSLWQRNYWEHVVRNDRDMQRIREYVRDNPARWELDRLFVPE